MEKPDFNRYNLFDLIISDKNGNKIYKTSVNKKAWEKTIENNSLWEYKDNGRVVPKSIDNYTVCNKSIIVNENIITIVISTNNNSDTPTDQLFLYDLEKKVIDRKKNMPPNSYTTHLFSYGKDKILKKLGEETVEVILAKENRAETIKECADLLYHLIVYLVESGISINEIVDELKKR